MTFDEVMRDYGIIAEGEKATPERLAAYLKQMKQRIDALRQMRDLLLEDLREQEDRD